MALQQSLRDLDAGYKNFFRGTAGHPKFKSKHAWKQTYRTMNQKDSIRIEGKCIRLPKMGLVKIRQTMPISDIHSATVEKTKTGKYFVILLVEFENAFRPNKGGETGIDMGIKSFLTDSDGNAIPNPKYLEKSLRKLKREQRKLSRMEKGSRNYEKQRMKVARIYEKVRNQRDDFLHKVSTKLVEENQTICIETLDVKSVVKKHRLAQSIASVSWSRFFGMLRYKASWYGCQVVAVPQIYPSSQLCHTCGTKNPAVKDLSVREWDCPVCGSHHDRDWNAAKNILQEGLRLQASL